MKKISLEFLNNTVDEDGVKGMCVRIVFDEFNLNAADRVDALIGRGK